MEDKPPFSRSFVMRTTLKHMKRSVEISINKSFERLKDFDNDSATGREIIETLSVLHTLNKILDEFQLNNKHLFVDNK
jgi:hypothetical protein